MRRKNVGIIGFVLALTVGLAAPVAAQQGTLAGRVIDAETNQPLQDAQVQVLGAGDATAGGVLTNQSGQFRVSLSQGTYSVVVTLVGYETTRMDGVSVLAGETSNVTISIPSRALALNPVVVTVGRGREEKALDAPASISVVKAEDIQKRANTTPADYVKGLPGVDVVQTGLTQSNTVTRGFNNVFSGALLVMTDNRYARVPSLRFNAYNMIPTPALDIERVEVLLGPAAALYGPNSASGVMHLITMSPIDDPGTSISMAGGERSVFQGAFRQAWAFNENAGLKISGQYFRGDDFRYRDPVEEAAAQQQGANPLIAARDFDAERFGGEARLDLRPWDDGELIFAYGLNQVVNSIELTGIGAGQAKDWRYQYGHVRMNKGRFFAQAFMNQSDAGDTYILRTGNPIVDESRMIAGQLQYGFNVGEDFDVITGFDVQRTTPRTKGTITGSNEDDDNTNEAGGYVHATASLSPKVDLVGAFRVDHHSRLEDLNYSPRAALVFKPQEGQNLRLTFNRAFSTPTTNNLFLDIVAGRIPLPIPNPATGSNFGYDVRTRGVPETGFTFDETCAGGVQNFCMYSPFAPGQQLPANGAVFWDDLLVPIALSDPTLQGALAQLGLTPQQFAAIIGNPQPGDLESWMLRFNQEDTQNPFKPDAGPTQVGRIQPTITNTYEVGYKGVIGTRLLLSLDVYRSEINDFVGPLRVETPSVFLRGESVGQFLVTRMVGAGIPASVAQQLAAGIAGTAAQLPLGTIAPDQRSDSDMILTYRNFGDVDLWGSDLGFQLLATDKLSFTGSFSWVSEECFDFDEDGGCESARDVALNAPTTKGSLAARFDDEFSGFSIEGRVRYSDGFPMNSGVYIGTVNSYTVLDANMGYKLPWASGARVSLTVNNLFDNEHQEFIGAPEMGRIALLKLRYDF